MRKYGQDNIGLKLSKHAQWAYANTRPLDIYENGGHYWVETEDGTHMIWSAQQVNSMLEEMYPYAIKDNNFITAYAATLDEAEYEIEMYEDLDLEDGSYRPGRYTIEEVI